MNGPHQPQPLGELWMYLRDPRKLASVMIVQEVSQRELATAAGWKSHSYLGKLLRGEANGVTPDSALRIAHYLGLPVNDLFLTKVSDKNGRQLRTKRTTAA